MINKIRSEIKAEILLAAEAFGVSCKFNDEEGTCTIKEKINNIAFSYILSYKFAGDVARITKYETTYANNIGQCKINYVDGKIVTSEMTEFFEPLMVKTTKSLTIKPTYAGKR